MNIKRLFTAFLLSLVGFLITSCGSLPKLPEKKKGPVSDNSVKAWNTRQPGEGQGILGGFQQR